MRRAGRDVYRAIRRERLAKLRALVETKRERTEGLLLLMALAGLMAFIRPLWLIPVLLIGLALVVGWGLTWVFALEGNSVKRRMGGQAERSTARELRRLKKHGYRAFHSVPFERFNVDHVLVGPGGVYVVETKWSMARETFQGPQSPRLHDAAAQASYAARKIRLLLTRQYGIPLTTVVPVVALWGRAVRTHQESQSVDDVLIIAGGDLPKLPQLRSAGSLERHHVASALKALHAHARRVERGTSGAARRRAFPRRAFPGRQGV